MNHFSIREKCRVLQSRFATEIARRQAEIIVWLIVAGCADLQAQGNGPSPSNAPAMGPYKQMTLEQLMNLDVTSVAKEPEPYGEAPAAIQVVTGEDIEWSGASSIPEALRLADNLEVAQVNSHDWAISARGFNANLANKLLVLVDGREVYTPLYGGVEWNVQDYLLEDIDRIEVISGPGGTLWGADAVNGVINITTKGAKDTQGLYMEAGGGTELQDFTGVRYGGTLASNVYFRIYGKYFDRGSDLFTNGNSASDSWAMGQGGFRIDSEVSPQNQLTLQGDFYSQGEDDGSIGNEKSSGGNVLGRWSHTFSSDSDMSLQLYYDRTYLSQPFAASPAAPPYFTGFPAASLVDELDTFDLDFQDRLRLGERDNIVWGLGYRYTHEVDEDLSVVRFLPPVLDQDLYSAFVQDQIMLHENVFLTIGSKLEHNAYTGFELEPSARLQLNITDKQMVWAAVSRAVRTPSRYDENLAVVSGLVNPPHPYQFPSVYLAGDSDFISETVIAYELGYRAELGTKASASISTFYNDYNDLRSVSPTSTTATYIFPYPDFFQNNLEGDTYGFEASANYQILDGWRLHGGYDLLKEDIHVKPGSFDVDGALNETADPQQQFSLRSSLDLLRTVELDTMFRWVDKMTIDNGPTSGPVAGTVPSYCEMDARIGWRVTKHLELSLVGQNLLHNHHVEYGFPNSTQEAIERTVYAKVSYRW
jgi:iron complex outermembrane recepter protein